MDKKDMINSVKSFNEQFAKKTDSINLLKKIMNSMCIVDRKFFAGVDNESVCYTDEALPIKHGQTISQPKTVARMLLMADLKPKLNVLEIGSGSGWNAALVADLIKPGKIISTERIKGLQENAYNNYNQFIKTTKTKGLNVEFLHTDTFDRKSIVWKERFDRIIATAGANADMSIKLRQMGHELLRNHGLLLYPTQQNFGALELWKKNHNRLTLSKRDLGYSFVPLLEGI